MAYDVGPGFRVDIQHEPYLPGTQMLDIGGRYVCSTRVWLMLKDGDEALRAYDWERLVQLQTGGS